MGETGTATRERILADMLAAYDTQAVAEKLGELGAGVQAGIDRQAAHSRDELAQFGVDLTDRDTAAVTAAVTLHLSRLLQELPPQEAVAAVLQAIRDAQT